MIRSGTAAFRRRVATARRSIFGELLRRQRRWLQLFALSLVFAAIAQVLFAAAMRDLVDQGIVEQSGYLDAYLRNVLVAATLTAIAQFAFTQIIARLAYQVDYDLRVWLYTRLQSAEVRRLDAVSSGQVISRALTDVTHIETAMRTIPLAVGAVPALLGQAIYLVILDPMIGFLSFLALPLNLGLLMLFRGRLRALSWAELNERAEVAAAIGEPVRGIRVVHAFDRADDERTRVGKVALRVYRYAMQRVSLLARYDIALKALPMLVQAVLVLVGGLSAADGALTLGTFLLAFHLVAIVTGFTQGLDEVASNWQYMIAAQGRITDLLRLGRPPRTLGDPLPASRSGLAIEGVRVAYGDNVVLDDFDLQVAPGELVVLTGGPGSGKSTIAAVAAGVVAPDGGAVRVEGVDVQLLDTHTARRAVLVASEVPFFFAATLRENLSLVTDEPASDEELIRAVHLAGADDVVEMLGGGLDAPIGDRGLTLSGGQRQRLALARTLVRPPRVLVLDDALSAVNPALELEILRRITSELPDLAIVCITRRRGPSSIADRVQELHAPRSTQPAGVDEVLAAPLSAEDSAGLGERELATLQALREGTADPAVSEDRATSQRPVSVREVIFSFRWLVVASLIVLAVATAARLAPAAIIGNAADLVTDNRAGIPLAAVAMAVTGIVGGFASAGFRMVSQRYAQSVIYLLRRRVFDRLSRLGVDYYDREVPGRVAARVVYDLDVLVEFLQRPGFLLVTVGLQVLLAMVAVLVLSPSAFGVVLVAAIVVSVLSFIVIPRSARAFLQVRDDIGTVTAKLEEDFAARREIRFFGAMDKRIRQFADATWELRRSQRHSLTLVNAFGAVLLLAGHAVSAIVLYNAGQTVLAQTLTVGTAITLSLLAQNATQPLSALGQLYLQYQRAAVSWRRLLEPYDEPVLPEQRDDAEEAPPLDAPVRFQSVSFGYPGTGTSVLHDVDVEVESGSCVALVGYTGAGKSSVSKLLMRTYDPDQGSVRIGDVDISSFRIGSYRRRMGIVPQDAFLFTGTIRSNIAYGRPEATDDEIIGAARAVGAWDVLSRLDGGLDFPVREEGRNLTGAQAQLVALARAWLTEPQLMILDEATSALDADVESHVLDAISDLSCTTIMVTHRESVVAVADRILVMEGGRLVESGPPEAVIGQGGPYDRLWAAEPDATGEPAHA